MAATGLGPKGALLVLGMHRSGTSALTRGLEVLGVDLGRNLKPPVAGDNEKGFFEDWALSIVNDDLLALRGGRWDSLFSEGVEGVEIERLNQLKLTAIEAINREFGESRYFAFKDPRTCRTIEFWKDVLARQGLDAHYVIAFRNPMSVAKSLERRDKFPRARSYYLWMLHTLVAVQRTQGESRVFVDYDDLVREPRETLERVAAMVDDEKVAVSADALRVYTREFLDAELRHHTDSPAYMDLDSACPPEVRAVYDLLRRELASDGGDRAELDAAWAARYASFAAVAQYAPLMDALDRAAQAAHVSAAAARDGMQRAAAAVREHAAQVQARTAEHETESARLKQEALEFIKKLGDAEIVLSEERASRAALNAGLHAAAAKSAADEAELARLSELVEQADQLLAARDAALAAALEEVERLEAARAEDQRAAEHALREHMIEAAGAVRRVEELLALHAAEAEARVHALEHQLDRHRRDASARVEALDAELAARTRQAHEAESREAASAALLSQRYHDALQRYGDELTVAHAAQSAALRAAYDSLAHRLREVYASSSWRIAAPMRAVKGLVGGGRPSEHVASAPEPAPIRIEPPVVASVVAPRSHYSAPAMAGATPTMAFFTICSRNFLAFAKTLFQTLKAHHPEAQFYVALCDAPEPPFDPAQEPFPFIYLDDLDLPEWPEMSQRYNITEFNTAIKPFVIQHLMNRRVADCIVYMDPDIIVTSRMRELEQAFANGASAVLTPHVTGPAENVEVSDIKMLQYGVYNLGFAAFRVAPETQAAVAWWGRRLIKDCVIKLEEGLFVDQKWADLFPAFLSGLHVLRHPGYNVAYWNVAQRRVVLTEDGYRVNGEPLRFAHFSGSKLEDANVYSRHSGEFNTANIGDLSKLLDEYRARVFGNDHARYQKIPYAFSWDGAAGVNLHTPKPEHQPAADAPAPNGAAHAPAARSPPDPAETNGVVQAYRMVRTATNMAGGLPQLAAKATRALASGGFDALRDRIRIVREASALGAETSPGVTVSGPSPPRPTPAGMAADPMRWRKRLLFIDWSTPRPDRDAGSLTAFHLMEILTHLGYDVTFVPSDLEYLGAYTERLRALGVRCLHREDIGSIKNHLSEQGESYDFAFLCRAPIAVHYIDDIRAHARRAKIILNTSDLHFLRDMREAELKGDPEQIRVAAAAKQWELDIIRRCDVTIVMSEVERQLLAAELPRSDVRLIPLMFVEVAAQSPAHDQRRDIVFIGGFPHQPNVDAVLYFAREILPLVRTELPDAVWHVVGNAPPPEVVALGQIPGVRVHGYVKDIEPLFKSVRLSIAPLRYGAGIKGKLGTSLAYGVPAVATTTAVEGMAVKDGEHLLVADDPPAFASAIVSLYRDEARWTRMSEAGRSAMLREYSVTAGQRRIGALMRELGPGYPRIEAHEVRSYEGYQQLREMLAGELEARRELEASLVKRNAPVFALNGWCALCGRRSFFSTSFDHACETAPDGQPLPNWREHLACEQCGLQNRLRAALHLFYSVLRPAEDAAIYVTEQTTPLFEWMRARHPDITGSEFLGERCALGDEIDGVRNEDLTNLSFEDESFDYLLSFEVMHLVPDAAAAFREALRCLRAGGRFMFTAPFSRERAEKVVRARLVRGRVEHILEPERHYNPMNPSEGSLCYRYFAWDVLEDMRRAGFENCRAIQYWSRDLAYLGGEQFVFIGDKPRKPTDLH